MSLAYTQLKPIKVVDPRVNVSEAKNYLFKQGSNVVTHRTFTSTSASSSNIVFKCNPPNPDIVVSRLVYLTVRVLFKFRFTDQNGTTPVSGVPLFTTASNRAFCPRQFPLSSVMRTLKVNINSDTLSVQPHYYIHALGRYNLDDSIRAYEMSSSPSQPDPYQKYSDAGGDNPPQDGANATIVNTIVTPNVPYTAGQNYGENRSPFALYGEVGNEIPRASYKPISVTENLPTTDVVYEFTEPLFISPLSGGQYNLMGLSQVSTMDVEVNLDSGKLWRMLSANLSAITRNASGNVNTRQLQDNYEVSISNGDCKMSFVYMTPQINRPKPESLIYDYHDLNVYHKEISTAFGNGEYLDTTAVPPVIAPAGANNQQIIQSDNMSLSSIPSRVYIFAQVKDSRRTIYTTDTFLNISKIDINFNGVSGILSSAQEWELWRMSSANGLKMSYNQWKSYTGSVLCIDFGKNMGLGPQQCVGLLGSYDFSYNVTLKNLNSDAELYELITLIDSAGTFTISNGQVVKQLGVVSSSDVIESEEYDEVDGEYLEKLYGGNFMSGLKNVYSKAQKLKPYAKKAVKIGKQALPLLETIAPRSKPFASKALDIADELLGQGYTQADINRMKRLGYSKADMKKLAGGNMVGGMGYPKSKLAQRMKSIR